jgi:hypothetical protein
MFLPKEIGSTGYQNCIKVSRKKERPSVVLARNVSVCYGDLQVC